METLHSRRLRRKTQRHLNEKNVHTTTPSISLQVKSARNAPRNEKTQDSTSNINHSQPHKKFLIHRSGETEPPNSFNYRIIQNIQDSDIHLRYYGTTAHPKRPRRIQRTKLPQNIRIRPHRRSLRINATPSQNHTQNNNHNQSN